MAFQIKSPEIQDGNRIPDRYTCVGEDLSPPLTWSGAPKGTQEFVLINDDPDAPGGTWVHWILYKIPATVSGVSQGIPPGEEVSGVGLQGKNSFGKISYGGPCPPPGPDHRYFFKLYALAKPLEVSSGLRKEQLLEAMQGSILEETHLMGTFSR